ncbi:MAG: hypothetical protein ACK55I_10195, partial [bacterium]
DKKWFKIYNISLQFTVKKEDFRFPTFYGNGTLKLFVFVCKVIYKLFYIYFTSAGRFERGQALVKL